MFSMDPAIVGEASQTQSLNDIQNYLATFNKEIQDTGPQELNSNSTATATNNTNSQNFNQNTNYTAPFNAQMNQVQDYQSFDQTQNFYNNTPSYYTSNSSGYQTSMDQQQDQQFQSFDTSFPVNSSNGQFEQAANVDASINSQNWQGEEQPRVMDGTQIMQTTMEDMNSGTRQISIKNENDLTTVVENMPIIASVVGSMQSSEEQRSLVMMEAGLEGQVTEGTAEEDNEETVSAEMVAGVQLSQPAVQSAEELLHAVQAQDIAADQPTFVAMQPMPGDTIGVTQGDDTVMEQHLEEVDHSVTEAGISALIQAGAATVHEGTAQVVTTDGQTTIQMVVHHADGSTHQQQIPVSTGSAPPGATVISADGQEVAVSDDGTLQMITNLAEQAAANEGGELGNNSVILNTGNSYQTVTIVPSDTNPGEVSYVLIVSQPEDGKDGQPKNISLDMSVYDFSEEGQQAGDGETTAAEQAAAPAKRAIKVSPKKSQLATQAHMCNYCNYTSPKRYLLSRHMKSHSEERPHKCNVCERGFKTIASLQNHINTHTGTRPHQCKECDSAFTTSGELVRHVRYKHTHEKPHKCTECDYASVELSKLKRHMRCHTGERPYQCPHCTYASPDTYKLKRHLRIHTGEKPYECDVCHARFTQSNSLKAHKLIHSGNKPMFQCELCPTTCGRKTDLRIHVQKLHTSDKPLKCKRCGKSFPDRYTYKVHVKTHEGEKCFKCDLCPYASVSQRHLESHMLIHADTKPFNCDECDQSFRQKQLLKRHMNLYHDPNYVAPIPKEKTHECPTCQKAFRHRGNLIRHMAVHDPDAPPIERIRLSRRREDGLDGDETLGSQTEDEEEDEEESEEEMEGEEIVTDGNILIEEAGDGEGDQIILHTETGIEEISIEQKPKRGRGRPPLNPPIIHIEPEEEPEAKPFSTPKGRRGRPRKYFRPEEVLVESPEKIKLIEIPIENEITSPKGRGRKRKQPEEIEETVEMVSTSKRARRPGRRSFKDEEDEEEMVAVETDAEALARKEADEQRRREEMKRKEIEECFGFNVDEDDDDLKSVEEEEEEEEEEKPQLIEMGDSQDTPHTVEEVLAQMEGIA